MTILLLVLLVSVAIFIIMSASREGWIGTICSIILYAAAGNSLGIWVIYILNQLK